ncbi:glycosyltransferase [Bradyrhizobium sp. CCGB12]|uniref:glycosyltransferase n=1 Tax=Bradyrhizobium sp. CCGB12 TaxID=2949632 RepID=UPI0020B3A6E6|nr:glycosyltransferase [Bradyrhizobium sp. CCGB12]MCP3392308.1 glycosyltransferase [Bradyrhizobium sp. CCGB12]
MTIISPGLQSTRYFFDERHSVLSDAAPSSYGPNIGTNGQNLTISFLSLNRAGLSIKLLKSIAANIANFAGEVLIGDNGSNPEELGQLKACLAEFPYRYRLLEFESNFGVAGGRNRIMEQACTDWVISVDNDIFFFSNPIRQIQRELALLGCHFMSFPLLNPDLKTLFSHGACLQSVIQEGSPRLTINPIIVPGSDVRSDADGATDTAFLSTFLFGGASIINRGSFHRLGGFDDNMLIGFEDIDFSLRIFREGMKIGTSALRFLVHDHPKAETSGDTDYERTRFSRKTLYESARYLEAKTGFKIWGDEVESWMRSNEQKQGWAAPGDPGSEAGGERKEAMAARRRPRVALLTDTDSWAFANISRQLVRNLSDHYEFEIFPLTTLGEIEHSRWLADNSKGLYAEGGASALGLGLVAAEGFDIIHVFWREFLTIIDTPLLEDYARRIGFTYPEFRRRFIECKTISISVYDHLFLSPEDMSARAKIFNVLASGYYVSSERLRLIYDAVGSIPRPDAVLPDGVDLTVFSPTNLERFDHMGDRLVRVGWVGHSGWASSLEDFKGVNSILKPAIEELQAEGLPIVMQFADRKERFIPHAQMPNYYAGIDVLVCTSKIEGTPNPVLEAMACGVPVVTTDVGIVPQALGPLQREFILPERSVSALKDALRRLVGNRELFARLSGESLEYVKAWDWSERTKPFGQYFDGLLQKARVAEGEARTKMCMLPFSNPSMEPDGSIRLCSASSIFAYYDETNMGNCQTDGLASVWQGERYQAVRRGLLTGHALKPYCGKCEYRHEGPSWLLQIHLALHAYHNGTRTSSVLALLGRRVERYEEYREAAPSLGLNPLPMDPELHAAALAAFMEQQKTSGLPMEARLAPEPLVTGADLPIYMDFNTLNRCNVSCTMCPPAIRFDVQGKKRDPYYRLTLAEYKKITNGARVKTAHFVGAYAEPLLNKEIFDLVAHANSNGAFTAVTSNGMALNEAFANRLLDAGLDMITISLHGATKEVAEGIMHKSSFDRVVANIRSFQGLKKQRGLSRPEIYFNYVGQHTNVKDMPAFIELAADLGVRFVNFIHLIDGDEAVDKTENLIHYPDILAPNILKAKQRAKELGVYLSVSPAYEEIVASYYRQSQSIAAS